MGAFEWLFKKKPTQAREDSIERREKIGKSQRPEDEDFGFSVSNPVCTRSARESNEYLSRLMTVDGERFKWLRTGAISLKELGGVENVIVDSYLLYLNWEKYATLYICPYGYQAKHAPAGLLLVDTDDYSESGDIAKLAGEAAWEVEKFIEMKRMLHELHNPGTDIFKEEDKKPIETEDTKEEVGEEIHLENEPLLFCRKCGSRIPADSKFCYKCGEKVYEE